VLVNSGDACDHGRKVGGQQISCGIMNFNILI
jgi:hypothetical protein